MFPGLGGLDPSKLTPQVIAEITEAMKMLSPDQMMKMQTLMHNQMAGLDVTREMMEFEKSFPQGFREKMARVIYMANGIAVPANSSVEARVEPHPPENLKDARMVILRSVAQGLMKPEEALQVLFPES